MNPTLFDAKMSAGMSQLHALLVGVGDYPHLVGGTLYDTEEAPKTFTLQQLTSPQISASAVADWLLSEHDNPTTPLGSIELLLSPATYAPGNVAAGKLGVAMGSDVDVPLATFGNIKDAAERWFQRLRLNPDNIALFYFCGHGLEASDRYLLAADYGSKPLDWMHGIINFTKTYNNMEVCPAQTQCFLLDACRDKPIELQVEAARGSVGEPLIGAVAGATRERDAPIFHAAAPGQSAAGPSSGKSYFCQALIDCLNGMGSRPPVGNVAAVDHVSLGSALKERVDRIARDLKPPLALRCVGSGDVMLPLPVQLHRAKIPVQVMTTVSCRPDAADVAATITVIDSSGTSQVRPVKWDKPWRFTVLSGTCHVAARFDPAVPFADVEFDAVATPPVFPIPLQVGPRP